MRAITKRLRSFQRELRDFILEKDALGLGDRPSFIQMAENVFRRQYEFLSNPAKLEAFRAWFQRQVDAGILAPLPGAPPGRPWTAEYVESAYKRGQMNAFLASKREGLLGPSIFGMTPEQFLISSFMAPEAMSKVLLLGTRAWNEMKGLTDAMGQQLNRILAQGIADGIGVERIAKQMTDVISGLARSRALTIARSEIIRAHAEGQLDAYDKLGVAELGVQAEWSTAHDERVCPRCAPNEGKTFTIAEARGLIPLHPNCRCSWIPSVPKNLTKT
jgi:SPP1 gp7 family putative phage head morphogenesis protein